MTMRKVFLCCIVIVLVFCLFACGRSKENTNYNNNTETELKENDIQVEKENLDAEKIIPFTESENYSMQPKENNTEINSSHPLEEVQKRQSDYMENVEGFDKELGENETPILPY